MKSLFLVLLILFVAVEISSKRGGRKSKLLKRIFTLHNPPCSALQPECPADKFCIPFISKCTTEDGMFHEKCYIDAHCPVNQTCSISVGYCLSQPTCDHMEAYSFCRKDWCACPDGYECKGPFGHQKCWPIQDGSGAIVVN